MNLNDKSKPDKDFFDKFIEIFEPYQKQGIRFIAVAISFIILFIAGTIFSPAIIRSCKNQLPFVIQFIQLSPFELIFNYIKIGFFFSLFFTLPLFIYQFGKLKINKDNIEEKTNLLIVALILFGIIIFSAFLTYKFIFPIEIMLLYGVNTNITEFTTSLSGLVSTFIFNLIFVTLLILLPFIRILIKKSLFFNYATLFMYKKPIMIYIAILSGILALPLELISLGFVFVVFFLFYKLLIIFAKKRD